MIIVRSQVPNPSELLSAGAYGAGAIVRVQSGAAQAGPFTNAGTVLIVAATYEYTFYDSAGAAGTWYRLRYENAGGTITSAWGAAFQPTTSASLCDLAEVKAALGLADTNVTADGMLMSYMLEATAFIHDRTRRTFWLDPPDGTTRTYTYDGWDFEDGGSVGFNGKILIVPRGIVSLTSVQVRTYTGGPQTTIPTSDWFLRPTTQETDPGWPFLELWITNVPSATDTTPSFYAGFGTVDLTGVFGWATIPPTLAGMCKRLSVGLYRQRGAGGGDNYHIAEDGTRTFERMLSAQDIKTLSYYRLKAPVII